MASQSLTVLSLEADATTLPSGEKATELTSAQWALKVCSAAPVTASQSLEKALEGKNVGDELTVAVEPEDAYGEYSAELVSTLSRSMFEGVDELEVGMQFHASAPDGQMQIVTIRDLDGDDVTVDGNHPLAGQRLNFQVKIVAIRDASQEEVAHGHVHGEGGHHH